MNRLDAGPRGAIATSMPSARPGARISFIDGALWLIVVVPVCLLMFIGSNDLNTSAICSAILVTACLVLLFRSTSTNPSNLLVTAFAVVYSLFHFGMIAVYLIDDDSLYSAGALTWFTQGEYVGSALKISILFLLGITINLFHDSKQSIMPVGQKVQQYKVGSGILIPLLMFLCCLWAIIVIITANVTDYIEYNAVFRGDENYYMSYLLVFIYPAISAVFLLGVSWSPHLKSLFVVFLIWGVVAFLVGLRGMVLFPLAAAIPVLHAQGRLRVRWMWMILVSWAVLALASFAREFRNQGGLSYSLEQTSTLGALAELGNSLRPAFEVQRWIDQGIENFYWGATYWAPFERMISLVLPFTRRVAAVEDLRLMNVAIVQHTQSNLGFSIAAEAFINFGYVGCLVIGVAVGATLLRIGDSIRAGRLSVIGSAMIYALFYHIRQSFVGAVATFIIFACIGLLVQFLVDRTTATRSQGVTVG